MFISTRLLPQFRLFFLILNPTEDAKPCVDEYFACSHIVPDKQTCGLDEDWQGERKEGKERKANLLLYYSSPVDFHRALPNVNKLEPSLPLRIQISPVLVFPRSRVLMGS